MAMAFYDPSALTGTSTLTDEERKRLAEREAEIDAQSAADAQRLASTRQLTVADPVVQFEQQYMRENPDAYKRTGGGNPFGFAGQLLSDPVGTITEADPLGQADIVAQDIGQTLADVGTDVVQTVEREVVEPASEQLTRIAQESSLEEPAQELQYMGESVIDVGGDLATDMVTGSMEMVLNTDVGQSAMQQYRGYQQIGELMGEGEGSINQMVEEVNTGINNLRENMQRRDRVVGSRRNRAFAQGMLGGQHTSGLLRSASSRLTGL